MTSTDLAIIKIIAIFNLLPGDWIRFSVCDRQPLMQVKDLVKIFYRITYLPFDLDVCAEVYQGTVYGVIVAKTALVEFHSGPSMLHYGVAYTQQFFTLNISLPSIG